MSCEPPAWSEIARPTERRRSRRPPPGRGGHELVRKTGPAEIAITQSGSVEVDGCLMMRSRFGRRSATVFLFAASVTAITVDSQPASAAPDLAVSVSSPDAELVGTTVTYSVEAFNPSNTPGYNTGFRVVLPPGVVLQSSSLGVSAQLFADQPSVGSTTVVWVNVNDSQPSSTEAFTFTVTPDDDFVWRRVAKYPHHHCADVV